MRESQRRINEYKRALPRLKEKVIAVALLLAVSASMMVTVTFAWVALSTNPEVSGVNTSIASNGNLEIALATGTLTDASAPGASQIGDSNLDTLLRNVTWGNLINLGDARYGLDNIVLRPALLYESELITSPLYGPVYDASGRVVDLNTNFGYSKWKESASRFDDTDELGIRAITSMVYGEDSDASIYGERLNRIKSDIRRAQVNYQNMAYNQEYMDALASMMTGYMVQNVLKVNSSVGGMISDATILKNDLKQFSSMYRTLMDSYVEFADVLASLLNLQAELNGKSISITGAQIMELPYDTDTKSAYNALLEMGFETCSADDKTIGFVEEVDLFLSDYNILVNDVVRIDNLISSISGTSVSWPKSPVVEGTEKKLIDDIIDNLVNVKECTITGGEYKNLKIKSVGATAAMSLKNAGTCETKITNGVLYNFDSITGARIKNPDGNPLKLTVQVMGTQTITSNVSTSAEGDYFANEVTLVKGIIDDKFSEPKLIANDTYGFAVDFWVRTNAANSYLTLQGNVLTDTEMVDVKGKDLDGNEVQLYTITVKVQTEESESTSSDSSSNTEGGGLLEDLNTVSYDVYYYPQKDADGKDVTDDQGKVVNDLRYASNHQIVTAESLGLAEGDPIPEPSKKVEEVEYVIGFEGDNRIWEGDQHSLLSVNSTTQGSGSCYVFYAETPVDQERSLELLKSMKVAFVSADGTLLATAYMDSDRHFSDSGKVIVPMVLDSESTSIGTDEDGNIRYAITALEQNVPTRITAIVYLDGSDLTNDDVLASADIEGRMNIQFGSSAVLYPLDNETLYNAELYAEVDSISPGSFDYDTLAEGDSMTSHVKVRITGTQPKVVIANFIRRINATQGSPEDTFILTDADGDGVWEGDYTFLSPGTYILRSVTMDGVERDLQVPSGVEGKQYPTVVVKGFSISSVNYSMSRFVMTDAGSYSGTVSLKFATDDPEKMPTSVIGKFTRGDGVAVNVNFVYNPTSGDWQGRADFVSSGEYTMQYVILDGEYTELAQNHQCTVELILGMRVHVETLSDTNMIYGDENTPETLEMRVQILDNSGNLIPSLANADLYYSMGGPEILHTRLIWNGDLEVYEGEFRTAAGTWRFSRVEIEMGNNSKNTLTAVNSNAPVFVIIPPTPPTFVRGDGTLAQLMTKASDKGSVFVYLKDATSAKVVAMLVNEEGKVDYVLPKAQDSGGDFFVDGDKQGFIFPVDDGLWTLKAVSAFNVFDSDSNLHSLPSDGTVDTEEDFESGVVFEVNAEPVAVLHTSAIEINVNYDETLAGFSAKDEATKTYYYGTDANKNPTAGFMTSHALAKDSIVVTFSDPYGFIRSGKFTISNVKANLEYDTVNTTYGGYTAVSNAPVSGVIHTPLSFVGSGTRFTLSDAVSLQYAAKYGFSDSDSVNDIITYDVTPAIAKAEAKTVTGAAKNAYTFEVWSKAPTVYISDITMDGAGAYSVDLHTTGSLADTSTYKTESSGCFTDYVYTCTTNKNHIFASKNTGYISRIEEGSLTAWLYFKCNHDDVETYDGGRVNGYNGGATFKGHTYLYNNGNGVPAATLTLTDMGKATNAKLTFVKSGGGEVVMITQYTADRSGGTYWGDYNTYGTDSYVWNSNGECKRFIGVMDNGAGSNKSDTKTVAGTIIADTLTLTYNGVQYSVPIAKITINNPY